MPTPGTSATGPSAFEGMLDRLTAYFEGTGDTMP
jgi:hypothetical protein